MAKIVEPKIEYQREEPGLEAALERTMAKPIDSNKVGKYDTETQRTETLNGNTQQFKYDNAPELKGEFDGIVPMAKNKKDEHRRVTDQPTTVQSIPGAYVGAGVTADTPSLTEDDVNQFAEGKNVRPHGAEQDELDAKNKVYSDQIAEIEKDIADAKARADYYTMLHNNASENTSAELAKRQAERDEQLKRDKRNRMFAALGKGISSIAGAVGTQHYGSWNANQDKYDPVKEADKETAKNQAQWQKDLEAWQANNKAAIENYWKQAEAARGQEKAARRDKLETQKAIDINTNKQKELSLLADKNDILAQNAESTRQLNAKKGAYWEQRAVSEPKVAESVIRKNNSLGSAAVTKANKAGSKGGSGGGKKGGSGGKTTITEDKYARDPKTGKLLKGATARIKNGGATRTATWDGTKWV